MSRTRATGCFIVMAMAGLASSSAALAQPVAHDAAAAEVAFAEARALMAQGKIAEACPKLETSLALDPAVGTLLNLADCFERTGRLASAWVRYREAAAMAVQHNQREREVIARERATTLEPRLCRLTVRAADRDDLVVLHDGVAISRAARGLPVPVDPGKHVITAQAPGATTFTTQVEIPEAPKTGTCPLTVVEIPPLEGDRGAVAAPPLKPIDLESASPSAPPQPVASGWATIHTLALVSAAGGLVAVGVGSAFGLQAASKQSDGEARCTPQGCSAEGKTMLADAGQSADAATVSFVVGAALLATGAVLWLASPSLSTGATATRRLGIGTVRF